MTTTQPNIKIMQAQAKLMDLVQNIVQTQIDLEAARTNQQEKPHAVFPAAEAFRKAEHDYLVQLGVVKALIREEIEGR